MSRRQRNQKYLLGGVVIIVVILLVVIPVALTKRDDKPFVENPPDDSEVITSWVDYLDSNDTLLSGYWAQPRNASLSAPRPGIVIAPYNGGIGANEMNRAEELAKEGYIALVLDVYGKGIKPVTSAEKNGNTSFLRNNVNIWRDRANAGLKVLADSPLVDPNKMGSAGYCFGGSTVMELARSGAPVKATVSFHGSVSSTTPDASAIQGQILVCNGRNDTGPTNSLAPFIVEMNASNVSWNILNHKNAVHCFTDTAAVGNQATATCAYNAKADLRSWNGMLSLFSIVFNRPGRSDPPPILLVETPVEYNDTYGNLMEGYLVYASDSDPSHPRPGVAVNHAWGGIGENEIYRCRNLARAGFIAFAVDVYGKGIRPTTTADRVGNTSVLTSNITLWRARANDGLKQLITNPLVNPNKLAAAGYCFGGSTTMELARSGASILAASSFHGSVSSRTPNASAVQAQLLVCNGQLDVGTSQSLQPFMAEMNASNVTWNILNLKGAVHCFTDQAASGPNATANCAYNLEADKRSHDAMFDLFNEVFL